MNARSHGGWRGHRFFVAIASVIALTVFVGFAPTYYVTGNSALESMPPRIHVHSVLFTAWVLLFLVQVLLVSMRRTKLHKRIGSLGGALAAAMVLSGLMVAVAWARHGSVLAGRELSDQARLVVMVIPFGSVAMFSILAALGLWYRRRADVHKRLMLLATVALLPPAFARMPIFATPGPGGFLGVTILFILALAAYDVGTRKRVHPASLWGGMCLAVSFPGRLAVGNTEIWRAFAQWLVG